MKKPFQILKIRFLQLYRIIVHTGIGWILLAIFLLFGMLATMATTLLSWNWDANLIIGVLLILSTHLYRKDLQFLRSICKSDFEYKTVLTFEYWLLLSPLIFLFGLNQKWESAVATIAAAPLVAIVANVLPKISKSRFKAAFPFFPIQAFELKTKFQRFWPFWLVVYIASFLSFIHIAFFIVSCFLFSLLMLESFKFFEPPEMVRWKDKFVWSKFRYNFLVITSVLLIPIIISLVFNPALIWLTIYTSILVFGSLFLAISFKYASYTPLYPEMPTSNIPVILFLLSILPGFILILIGYSFIQYLKAEKNMQYYYA